MSISCIRFAITRITMVLSLLFSPVVSLAGEGLPADGQPASDILMSYDLWGNPTPVGGVTNGGSNSHSIW